MRPAKPLAAFALVVAISLLWPTIPAEAAEPVTLSVGHTDALSVHFEANSLRLKVKDDTGSGSLYRDPADVRFQVLPRAKFTVPELPPSYDFLGETGDEVWLLPLTQDPELLWPGWSTESIAPGTLDGDKVAMTLAGVDGPGEVMLWTTDSFGTPKVTFNSADGLPDTLDVAARVHAHSYWAFTEPGDYTLTWKIDATVDGAPVSTGPVDHAWTVGDAPAKSVLAAGHTDALSVHYGQGALDLKVKDDTQGHTVYRDPGDVLFQVRDHAAWTLPELPEGFGFLGEEGDTVWLLPDTMDQTLLWPGWSTETLGRGVFRDDSLKLSLVGANGPGEMKAFAYGDFGDAFVQFDTADGLPDATDVIVPTHAHTNWVFTAPGEYTLRFQATGVLADGTAVSSPVTDYTWIVGDDLPSGTPAQPGARLTGLEDPVAVGANATVTAVPTADLDGTYRFWYRKCPGETLSTQLDGETGLSYTFTATAELDGCRYTPVFRDSTGRRVVGDSATLRVGDGGSAPGASQTVTASIDGKLGGLIISVDPSDRDVRLPVAELAPSGDHWETSGALRPVTVTDTRTAAPGWNASGQAADFTGDGGGFSGGHLGWTPQVTSQADGQGVVAGPFVPSALESGNGLATGATLASAPAGAGTGTAVLGGRLVLWAPTDTTGGTYTTTITLTVI